MREWAFSKADGRKLYLYSWDKEPGPLLEDSYRGQPAQAHLRWHPLQQEWVIYAPQRQGRTYHPPRQSCPFCPGGEVPFGDFEIAVVENRYPALSSRPGLAPQPPVPSAPAYGRSEVVIYTANHNGSLARLSQERRRLLVRVWAARYRALYELPEVRYVFPFENRGEEVGVTLFHPHGQIYAYPFVPASIATEAAVFAKQAVLQDLWPRLDPYHVAQRPGFLAFTPPFARFPYEVWIAPEQPHLGPWSFSEAESDAFADLLGEVALRLDGLFSREMPYVMAFHAAPKDAESFHFHVEIYPKLRSRDKQKHLAGTEVGVGIFTAAVLPEEAARLLREAGR